MALPGNVSKQLLSYSIGRKTENRCIQFFFHYQLISRPHTNTKYFIWSMENMQENKKQDGLIGPLSFLV